MAFEMGLKGSTDGIQPETRRAMRHQGSGLPLIMLLLSSSAVAAEDFQKWPTLRSSFPSTGGGGITIKGYDPVITGGKCISTFMAVEAGENPQVYSNVAEFDAVPTEGGVLCTNGRWRSFDGSATGTTPFRFFFKDGVFRAPS